MKTAMKRTLRSHLEGPNVVREGPNVFRERNHTRWMTDCQGKPFNPSHRPDYMTEKEFDRTLRAVKPRQAILALCDRVDQIQKEAGVYEEVMKGALLSKLARRRTDNDVMADVRLLEELRRG